MENILIDAGLTKLQAQAYLYLLENGSALPKTLMSELNISRTNTYKVLESLDKFGLARKEIRKNKTIYYPEDPTSLASLVAEKRNIVLSLEHKVNKAMQQLNSSYRKHQNNIKVETLTGKQLIIASYDQQSQQRQPIYFLKSRADITFMGFDTMDDIRNNQGKLSRHRYGITTDSIEAPKNENIDKRTGLTRTWIKEDVYTAPVEWSVSGNSIIIQVFEGDGKTVIIRNELIAESFRQMWHITDKALRNTATYKMHPNKASRKV
jgi:predicted transcriptional regulator